METLTDLLDALNERTGLSDRKLGPLLGAGEGAATQWRTGRSFPADEKIPQIAKLLDQEPAYVAAVINLSRAKSNETRAMWQRVAQAFGKAAALAAVAVAPALTSPDAQARFDNSKNVPTPAHQEAGRNTQCTTRRRRTASTFALAARALLAFPGHHFAL